MITSGGGFSNITPRTKASWQEKVVNEYLKTNAIPNYSFFNQSGRGYPDVSAYGADYFVYLNGRITRESGTSASTPVFAAIVTLLNDIRLANDLPPMGFINPFLYEIYDQYPEAFHDITTGDNVSHKLSFKDIYS